MNINEPLEMKGCLTIESEDSNGNRTTLLDDKNLIVLSGRNAIVEVLAGTQAADSGTIVDIAFGDDGVLPTNSSIAKQVLPTDYQVNHEIQVYHQGSNSTKPVNGQDYTFSITPSSSQSTPKAIISVTVPRVPIGFTGTDLEAKVAGLNGKSLSELALMMGNGKAFSIKRFPAIPKSVDIAIIITWKIYA